MKKEIVCVLNTRFKNYLDDKLKDVRDDHYYNLGEISKITNINASNLSRMFKRQKIKTSNTEDDYRLRMLSGKELKTWFNQYVKKNLSRYPEIYKGYLWNTASVAKLIGIKRQNVVYYTSVGKIKPMWRSMQRGTSNLYSMYEINRFKNWYYSEKRLDDHRPGRKPHWSKEKLP